MRPVAARALLLAACLSAAAARAEGPGETSLEFLSLSASARAAALGGGYTALARDAAALHYNAAGLGASGAWEASFMDNEYFAGVSQQIFALSAPGGWGLGVNRLGYGETERTTISNPDGALGTFGGSDLALSAGYAREVRSGWRAGAAVKYLKETIDDASASGTAWDAGVLYERDRGAYGLSIRNLGKSVRFQSAAENLPASVHAGAVRRFLWLGREHRAIVDVGKPRGDRVIWSLGVESVVAGGMAVRLGYDARADAGPGIAFGLGWDARWFAIDYAFAPMGDLGSAHRVGLSARWGRVSTPERLPEPPPDPERVARVSEEGALRGLEEAELLFASDKLREAERAFSAVERALPKDDARLVRIRQRLGDIAMLQGYWATAKVRYGGAIELAGALGTEGRAAAEATAGLGRAQLMEGDRKAARRAFEQALGMDLPPALRAQVEAALKNLR